MKTVHPFRLAAWMACLFLVVLLAGCAGPARPGPAPDRLPPPAEPSSPGTGSARGAIPPAEPEAASGREGLPESPELGDYLRYGLEHNAGLREAWERWRSAEERILPAGTLPDPRLDVTHWVEDVQTRTGPQENVVGLSQTFPFYGKLDHQEAAAAEEAAAKRWEVETVRLDVVREITQAYYEYAWLGEAVRITRDNVEILQNLEPIVQRAVQTGASQAELLRLQVEIGRVEDDLATLQARRPVLSDRLRAALNLFEGGLLPWPAALDDEVAPVSPADLERRLADENPTLQALRRRVFRDEEALARARLEGWPDLTIGVRYLDTGGAITPNTPGSGEDPYGIFAGINLPIWRDKYAAETREAEARRRGTLEQQQETWNRLRAALAGEVFALDDAARKISLFRDTLLPRARQTLADTEAAYQAGAASVLDLIDSERTLLAFENSLWRAVADHEQTVASLETLIGGALR